MSFVSSFFSRTHTLHLPLRALLATALLGAHPATGHAVDGRVASQPARPRICLVLSGGGARGAAHIGVLKVLEEMRIPIDCIAGTSMGSIVGGSYAAGASIAAMEQQIKSITSETLFKDKPPRQDVPIHRKQDDQTLYFSPELGVRDGKIMLPKGIVSGIVLEAELRKLAMTPGYINFDELPIPFRAVATDIASGQMVVFRDGELASVMRASMSVPAAMDPVEIDGKLLVDGGLARNLPVDVARTMGADIVIAVNLGTPLLQRESITSVFGVTLQMINILTEQNVQASLASLGPKDILISPELGDFSATDFDHLSLTVPIGEAAARKVATQLAPYSLSVEDYAALHADKATQAPPDLRPVSKIRVDGLQRMNPAVVEAMMETKVGAPIDQEVLDRDIRRIYGRGDFEHVNYRIGFDDDGQRMLAIKTSEKSWGPSYLRIGLGLSSDFRGDSFFNLLGSYRKTWLNSLGAEWRADLQVGRSSRLFTELHQPLDQRQYLFVAPRIGIERRPIDLFNGNTRFATLNLYDTQAGVDVGSQFGKYGELRFGMMRGNVQYNVDTGPAVLPQAGVNIGKGGFTGHLYLDQLDSWNFPRDGYGGNLNLLVSRQTLGAQDDYNRWSADFLGAHSVGRHTLLLGINAGGAIGPKPLPSYDQFQFGGFQQLSGYRTGQFFGESVQFARLTYMNKLANAPFLAGAYAGFSLEAGRVGHQLIGGLPGGVGKSTSAFVALDSPLGPLYLAYGRALDGNSSYYLFLGRP